MFHIMNQNYKVIFLIYNLIPSFKLLIHSDYAVSTYEVYMSQSVTTRPIFCYIGIFAMDAANSASTVFLFASSKAFIS